MQEVYAEEWREVAGTDGRYQVSNHGRVRGPRGLRKLYKHRNGYLAVGLWLDGKDKTAYVHTLVAEAFIGPRPDGHQICHGSADRTDNRACNLSYGTRKQNAQDKWRDGTQPVGDNHRDSKLTDAQVLEIRSRYRRRAPGVKGNGTDLAREYGIDISHIYAIIRREKRVRPAQSPAELQRG